MGRTCYSCHTSNAGDGDHCACCNTYLGWPQEAHKVYDDEPRRAGEPGQCIRCRGAALAGQQICQRCRIEQRNWLEKHRQDREREW